MYTDISADEAGHVPVVSTGQLPAAETVQALLSRAFELYVPVDEGVVADYIPALARARRDLFGLCVVGVDGTTLTAGDVTERFSIQSVSKPFVFALICEAIGYDEARVKLGVNNTGLPFNSVISSS